MTNPINKNVSFTDKVNSFDRCLITKDGLLFESIKDLKDFVDAVSIVKMQKDAIDGIRDMAMFKIR